MEIGTSGIQNPQRRGDAARRGVAWRGVAWRGVARVAVPDSHLS